MIKASHITAVLTRNGQEMTLTHAVAGTFDSVTGAFTGGSSSSVTVNGITTNYGSMDRLSSANMPGSTIQTGDKKAIITAETKPLVGDTLTIMGTVWSIIAADSLDPQGETLLYNCQIRR